MGLFVGFEEGAARRRIAAILERWEANGDQRSAFLGEWACCTDAVLVAIRNGGFANPMWVLDLLDNLAGYYFITIEPKDDELGVNAVINNDLPQAVSDVLLAEWPLSNIALERRHQDLGLVLDIVAASVGTAGRASVECDTRARLAHLVDAWRDETWENALALVTAVDERWRDLIRESIEHTALRRAHLIMCDIAARSHLLELPAHRLDYVFPPRHRPQSCRLSVALPLWGGSARATTQ